MRKSCVNCLKLVLLLLESKSIHQNKLQIIALDFGPLFRKVFLELSEEEYKSMRLDYHIMNVKAGTDDISFRIAKILKVYIKDNTFNNKGQT